MSDRVKKFIKILIFSVLEALTIGLLWDIFFDKGMIVVASLATFLLLAVEHILARNTGDGLPLFASFWKRFGLQAVLGATEIIFWDIWRVIHQTKHLPEGVGPVVALIVFATLMWPQHNAEQNVSTGGGFFSKIFRVNGVTISFIEATTALAWILVDDIGGGHRILALVPLAIGLFFEHVVRIIGEEKGVAF